MSGNWGNIVKIWDIKTKTARELRGHNGVISSVNYSPDFKYIISSSWDKTINIWDYITGKHIKRLFGHTK